MLTNTNIDDYLAECEREEKERAAKLEFAELRRQSMRPNLSRHDGNPEIDSIDVLMDLDLRVANTFAH